MRWQLASCLLVYFLSFALFSQETSLHQLEQKIDNLLSELQTDFDFLQLVIKKNQPLGYKKNQQEPQELLKEVELCAY